MSNDIQGKFLVYAGVGVIAGAYLLYRGFKLVKKRRKIIQTPTSKVRSMAMGEVEVKGKVKIHENDLLISPLSKKKCSYYEILVEEYKREGKRSRWVRLFDEKEYKQFYIEDSTGKVHVDPKDAEIELTPTYNYEVRSFKEPPKELIEYLQTKNENYKAFWKFNRRLRVNEYTIYEDEQLYILGTAGKNNDEIKPGQNQEDYIMIQKGNKDSTFYICSETEERLISILNWKIFGCIFGGGSLILFGLLIIFAILDIL